MTAGLADSSGGDGLEVKVRKSAWWRVVISVRALQKHRTNKRSV